MRFTIPKIMFTFFILIFALVEGKQHPQPCKELPSLYFHDIVFNGTNAETSTSAIVAAPAGSNLTTFAPQFRFGNIIVFDNPLTLDSNLSSPQVGRAQGMYLYNSKLFPNAWVAFSLVLNSTDYQGTINLVGANPLWGNPPRDISIVGATGDFFMHRGVATLLTDGIEGIVYIRLKIDVKFYECEFDSFSDS